MHAVNIDFQIIDYGSVCTVDVLLTVVAQPSPNIDTWLHTGIHTNGVQGL